MNKFLICALLALSFAGNQAHALATSTEITIGNFSCAYRKFQPGVSDETIYTEFYKIKEADKTNKTTTKWDDMINQTKKENAAKWKTAIEAVTYMAAAAANVTDGSKYTALKIKDSLTS